MNNIYQKRKVMLFILDGFVCQDRSFTDEIKKLSPDLNIDSFTIRTVLPSLPAVNLSSVLTGVPVEFHCVTSFSGPDEEVTLVENFGFDLFPTVFWYLFRLNQKAFLFSENKRVENIVEKELIDFRHENEFNPTSFKLKDILLSQFSCFHIGSLLKEGKKNGFESSSYKSKSSSVLKKIITFAEKFINDENFLFIIVSSSGGK